MLSLAIAGHLMAHSFQGMASNIVIGRSRITAILRLINEDAVVLSRETDTDNNGKFSEVEFMAGVDKFSSSTAARFFLANDGKAIAPSDANSFVVSNDPATSLPHELMVRLVYTLQNGQDFKRVVINPNLFREIEGKPLTYTTTPLATQINQVSIIDCDVIDYQSSGTQTYETTVGRCE